MKRDIYAEVTATIVAQMKAGTMPWKKTWQNGASGIPMNAISNRPYSGINVLLFWIAGAEGWARARFLTYKQAIAAGGHVRKGEKGTRVIYFKQLAITDKATGDEKKIPMLREYTVFNVSQCEGLPHEIMNGEFVAPLNQDQREAMADAFMRSTGADFREGAGKPCYVPSKDFITVPAFRDYESAPAFYADSFHELAHWTGHKSRLDRDMSARFDRQAYAAEELVAELAAAFLCAEFGFDCTDSHASYLASWIKLLQSDPRAIFTAASKAQAAANYLRDQANAAPIAIAA